MTEATQALTLQQVCDRLKIHRTSIYRLVKAGDLPEPIRVGSRPRWLESDVERLLSREAQP